MILQINEDWRISSDEHCFKVESRYTHKGGKKAGEVEWRAQTWHGTIEQAINGVYERRMRLIDAEGVVDTLKAIRALQSDAKALSEEFRGLA